MKVSLLTCVEWLTRTGQQEVWPESPVPHYACTHTGGQGWSMIGYRRGGAGHHTKWRAHTVVQGWSRVVHRLFSVQDEEKGNIG